MRRAVVVMLIMIATLAFGLIGSMIDVVHPEGDHTSYLVLAPYPTLGFVYGGGEEGAWCRTHPGEEPPFWLLGHYFVITEITGIY